MKTYIIAWTILLIGIGQHTAAQHEYALIVAGKCDMCQDRIEAAAKTVAGVRAANWSQERQLLHVYGEAVNTTALHDSIAATGHDTEKQQATDRAYQNLHNCCKYRPLTNLYAPKFSWKTITVAGKCDMCQERIEQAARQAKGVSLAIWDINKQALKIGGVGFSIKAVEGEIAAVGHDTEHIQASDEAYANLHACCKYRPTHDRYGSLNRNPKKVSGRVLGQTKSTKEALVGASVYWLGTTTGATTDTWGKFSLDTAPNASKLVVSFVGFQNDTLTLTGGQVVDVILHDAVYLDAVTVTSRQKTSAISHLSTLKSVRVSEGELQKAACCNLSESFETNPTVDVSFTDAVTGTKQIQMLGLAGPYVQITRENMPDVRGLSAIHGLTFTPGTWVEGIQLNLGAGSVANGFESVTGQINVELKKPEEAERVFLNLFGSQMGVGEANLNLMHRINPKWSTGVLLHGKYFNNKRDINDDGFLDMPLVKQVVGINRWRYNSGGKWRGQFGIKASYVDHQSGQAEEIADTQLPLWQANGLTKRIEAWAKSGYVSDRRPTRSFGMQYGAMYHQQTSVWGTRPYNANQATFYANLMFQDVFGHTGHKYRAGLSFLNDRFDETVADQTYTRNEIIPGAYFEYTYAPNDKFTGVVGLRGDYHSQFGFFATPRLHLRYAPVQSTVLRASVGRGQRTASIFAENIGAFASAREFVVHANNSNTPYGLDPEVAWNYGLNLTQDFNLLNHEFQLALDFFHTRFSNQIVVDYEQDAQAIHFYNLAGASYANSVQAQLDFELLPRWDMRLAYRFNDVWQQYTHGLKEKPLTSRFRSFINTSYATTNGWSFDFTANLLGTKRLPDTSQKPDDMQLDQRSPIFSLFNAQITKKWKSLELYAGGENLLDYRQDNPILSAADPHSEHFDASLVWGPVMGRRIYAGLRWKLQ